MFKVAILQQATVKSPNISVQSHMKRVLNCMRNPKLANILVFGYGEHKMQRFGKFRLNTGVRLSE